MEQNQPSTGSSPQPQLLATSKKRKNTSVVWNHFTKSEPDKDKNTKVKCKWCPQEYIWTRTTGTTNMKRHLKECSGIQDVEMSIHAFDEDCFREKLARAMVKHNLPFSFIEYDGIRDVFSYLNPDVVTISRKTSKADILKLHEKEKCVLKEIDDISMFEFEENALRKNDSEVDEYLRESRVPATQDLNILEYWKGISDRYPILAAMARDILCIPITTVASESTFSIGGRVIGKFRSSLTPDTAESLVCTRDWLFGVEAAQIPTDEEEIVNDFAPIIAQLDVLNTP